MSGTRESSNRKAARSLHERVPGRLAVPARQVPGAVLRDAHRVARPAELPQSDVLYAPLPEPRDQAVPEVPADSGESRRGVVQYDIS